VVGRPLKYLKVYSSRAVSRAGAMAIRSAMLMMILAGIVSIGVLWMYLRRAFVARVEALKTHFVTAGSSGKIATTDLSNGKDEISAMATSFNGMAEQVNHLRDALADSAYMTGLSEWAAGTLHNVRNGLAPVAATTWKIEQLFDPQWVKNVEVASREHADPETPQERRQKLNQFLVGTAGRFGTLARETCDLAAQVNAASQSVLDMVSEFEHYAHRKTEFEAIDLTALLQNVKASVAAAQASDIEIILPAANATLNGNGIILRQVFSNIFINAAEAIKAQNAVGRIEVVIAPSQHGAATRIAVRDNGEGISEDRLSLIFKRGESSRKGRKGGLGLHWCANAVRIHGGSIHAESDGPGKGATIILELPNVETRDQMAA
jgi:signal transduction histidine kinase